MCFVFLRIIVFQYLVLYLLLLDSGDTRLALDLLLAFTALLRSSFIPSRRKRRNSWESCCLQKNSKKKPRLLRPISKLNALKFMHWYTKKPFAFYKQKCFFVLMMSNVSQTQLVVGGEEMQACKILPRNKHLQFAPK